MGGRRSALGLILAHGKHFEASLVIFELEWKCSKEALRTVQPDNSELVSCVVTGLVLSELVMSISLAPPRCESPALGARAPRRLEFGPLQPWSALDTSAPTRRHAALICCKRRRLQNFSMDPAGGIIHARARRHASGWRFGRMKKTARHNLPLLLALIRISTCL